MKDWCDCGTAGWPDWLHDVRRDLYHARVGVDDEQAAADAWLHQLATAASPPLDYDAAQHRFRSAVLEEVKHLSPDVEPVIRVHQTQLEGGTPTQDESDDARAGRWYAQGNGWAVASIAKKAVGIAASEANRQTARAAARARSDAGGTGIACRDARIAAERQMRVAQRKHLLDALWSSRRQPGNLPY